MSNYNFVQPGVTRLAQRKLSEMTVNQLKHQQKLLKNSIDYYKTSHNYNHSRSHNNINANIRKAQQLSNYINAKIRNKNRVGGRRTRRNNRSKRSTRRR
jgi:hypothetical protein